VGLHGIGPGPSSYEPPVRPSSYRPVFFNASRDLYDQSDDRARNNHRVDLAIDDIRGIQTLAELQCYIAVDMDIVAQQRMGMVELDTNLVENSQRKNLGLEYKSSANSLGLALEKLAIKPTSFFPL
jgi:hypothetical protein